MNFESKRFPKNSGNVRESKACPILRVLFPKNTNAINTPMIMFKNANHKTLIPYSLATPPKPTIAAVEIKVAP